MLRGVTAMYMYMPPIVKHGQIVLLRLGEVKNGAMYIVYVRSLDCTCNEKH